MKKIKDYFIFIFSFFKKKNNINTFKNLLLFIKRLLNLKLFYRYYKRNINLIYKHLTNKKNSLILIFMIFYNLNLNSQKFFNYEKQAYVGLYSNLDYKNNFMIAINKTFDNSVLGFYFSFLYNKNINDIDILFNSEYYLLNAGLGVSYHRLFNFKRFNIMNFFTVLYGQEHFKHNNIYIERNDVLGFSGQLEFNLKLSNSVIIGTNHALFYVTNFSEFNLRFLPNNFLLLKFKLN